jgi:hypothetical protein
MDDAQNARARGHFRTALLVTLALLFVLLASPAQRANAWTTVPDWNSQGSGAQGRRAVGAPVTTNGSSAKSGESSGTSGPGSSPAAPAGAQEGRTASGSEFEGWQEGRNGGWTPLPKAMFGAMGQYIVTVGKAEVWGPPAGAAYRVDVSLMSSSNPIRYKTTFTVPGSADVAGMKAAGIKIVLTVRNSTTNNDLALPADGSLDAAFSAAIGAVIAQIKPDYLVYGNEVNDLNKYAGTAAEFQHLMTLGHAVAHSKGVLDGGTAIMGTVTSQATYADILATQGATAAKNFKSDADMPDFDQSLADKGNSYIDACKGAGLDFFVWHSYFASPSAILSIKSYVEERFGGPSFINELGWRTGSAKTGTAIINALNPSGIPVVLIYGSGIGTNEPDMLWDGSGTPTAEGTTITAVLPSL